MHTITLEFEDGALYRFRQDEDEYSRLRAGVWTPPYPNTREDSVVFGLLESWGQYPEGPIFYLLEEHGEPIRVSIVENLLDSLSDEMKAKIARGGCLEPGCNHGPLWHLIYAHYDPTRSASDL